MTIFLMIIGTPMLVLLLVQWYIVYRKINGNNVVQTYPVEIINYKNVLTEHAINMADKRYIG